jgi:hypothetical protein
MSPKKFLAVLLASALLFIGAEAALTALPHSHGNDFDHSHHGACPIHQLGLHGLDLSTASSDVIVFTPLVFFVQERAHKTLLPCFIRSAASRGPPAV